MYKQVIFLLVFFFCCEVTSANIFFHSKDKVEATSDTTRIAELDQYWQELSRTVEEGDFDGYGAAYHEDAVVIFAGGAKKSSMSISKALAGWKQGFLDTKNGKVSSMVEFRFSQRINDEDTAHETGIFHYSSGGETGTSVYVHFEMLMVKKDGSWLGLMEYQKSKATLEEWKLLN